MFSDTEDTAFGGLGLDATSYVNVPEVEDVYDQPQGDSPWDEEIDHAAEEAVVRASMPPGGYYDVQKLEATYGDRESEVYLRTAHGLQLTKQVRHSVRLWGKGYREVDGKVYLAHLRFSICPQVAYGKDKDGNPSEQKLNHSYKLYQAAKRAYEKVIGQAPKSPRDVVNYLTQYPVKLQTFQAADGLIVLGIEGVMV